MRPPILRAAWRHEDGYARAKGEAGASMPAARPRPRARPHATLEDADDVQRLLKDIAGLVAGVAVAAREFGRVSARLRGSVADLGEAMGDAWEVAREHGGGALRGAERAVASRPYVVIGLAAAAAIVVAGYAANRGLREVHRSHDEADGWDHFV